VSEQAQNEFPISEHDALNEIPSGVGVFDVTDGVIRMEYLNDGFYRMIGARREDRSAFFSTGTINSVHPDDRPGLMAEVLASIRENRMFEHRFRNLGGDGGYLWIGIRASHRPLDGKTERFYASYYNVDRLVSEHNELTAYSNRLDEILGSIPGGVSVFSEQGGQIRLVYTNAGFYAVHHGSREYWSAQSANPVDWLVPEDRHLFWDEFRRVARDGKQQGSVTYRVIGEDGAFHWVRNQFCRAERLGGVQCYSASFVDMDEQIAAEQELLQEKLMYDAAASSAKLIVWSYDIASHRALLMQSGYTKDICEKLHVPPVIENVAQTLLPYVHPDDKETFRTAYQSIDDGAESAVCEFRFQLPGQESLQQERMALRRIRDKNGRLLNVFCYGQNITEQKEKEERLSRAYEKIGNPDAYGSFRLNLTKNWCGNGAAGKSRIKSVLELQNSGTVDGYFADFSRLIADDEVRADFYRRFDRRLLLQQFEQGTQSISIDYPVVYEDGARHWREGFLSMVKNPRTGDTEAVTYSYDIDARKRDEFIMARLIHDHFDYIGIIHPAARTFEFHSRRPWITYGMTGEILPYEKCCEYVRSRFTREDERLAFDEAVSLDAILRDMDEKGTRTASYIRTAGAYTVCSRLQYSWLEKAGGDILVVRSDVSDAYQKEQEQMLLLEKEKRAAEAASIAKSEFLSRMSHDIRTPLNGIIGMTYLTQKLELPAKARENLGKIDTSSKFLLSLINDVLDMSRAESGRIELHPEPYPMEEFAEYVNSIIAPLCEERRQTFLFEPAEILPDAVPLLDKLRINQIVFNLLSNAVKYTPEGGTIRCRIAEQRLDGGHMHLHIDVIDNGIGMSEEFQKVLFDPFTQEYRADSAEARGSGLGLAITKRLIDAMGGAVAVTSRPGKGTAFGADFRLDCIPAGGAAEQAQPGGGAGKSLAGRHILLCEDHPLNQEIAKAILEGQGALVTIAGDGESGVRAFLGSSIGYYDCILMDIHMPVMDGYGAAKAIRALRRSDAASVPILAMTADAFSEDIQRCLDSGMNGHIAKPIDPDRLYRTLSEELPRAK